MDEPTLKEMEAALEAASETLPWAYYPEGDLCCAVVYTKDETHLESFSHDPGDRVLKLAAMAPGATARAIRLERALRRIAKMHRSMADLEGAEPSAVRDWFHVLTGIAVDALSPTLTEATPND